MARGSIVKRRSGNYAIVYYVDGKQKWETIGPSRRDAERALTARKREVDTGTWREPSSETLEVYAQRWLAHRDPARIGGGGRTRLAPSTFAGIPAQPPPARAAAARSADARVAADGGHRRADRGARGRGKRRPARVRNVIVPLRKMLGDAVRQGLIVANPAARADLPPAQDFVGKEIPRRAHARRYGRRWSGSRRTIHYETNRISSTSASSTSRSGRASASASSARSAGATSIASGDSSGSSAPTPGASSGGRRAKRGSGRAAVSVR